MKKQKQPSRLAGQPLVSVVMPVYNAGDFLVDAIESILAQTYKNFEFIIVDDASIDGSWQIIQKYKKLYPKIIKTIRMDQNLNRGGDVCANEGLKLAKGKYVARMDADDVAYPQRLEKQVEFLESHPKIFLVGSNADVIDKHGRIIGEKLEPDTPKKIYEAYFGFHPMIHPTCLYKRLLGKKTFYYDIRYSANNDYYTFSQLICQGKKFVNLPEKLLMYRIHGNNATFVNLKEKFMNSLKIRLSMVKKFGYKPRAKDIIMLLVQTVIVFGLPESFLTQFYLFAKGIVRFSNPFARFASPKVIAVK